MGTTAMGTGSAEFLVDTGMAEGPPVALESGAGSASRSAAPAATL